MKFVEPYVSVGGGGGSKYTDMQLPSMTKPAALCTTNNSIKLLNICHAELNYYGLILCFHKLDLPACSASKLFMRQWIDWTVGGQVARRNGLFLAVSINMKYRTTLKNWNWYVMGAEFKLGLLASRQRKILHSFTPRPRDVFVIVQHYCSQ